MTKKPTRRPAGKKQRPPSRPAPASGFVVVDPAATETVDLAKIPAGPTSIPDFEFCTTQEADRLLDVLVGGARMTGLKITAGQQIALGVHLVSFGARDFIAAMVGADPEEARKFVLGAVGTLMTQVLGVPVRIEAPPPAEPTAGGEVIPPPRPH